MNENNYDSLLFTEQDKKNLNKKPPKSKKHIIIMATILIIMISGGIAYFNLALKTGNLFLNGVRKFGDSFDFLVKPMNTNYIRPELYSNSGKIKASIDSNGTKEDLATIDYNINYDSTTNNYLIDLDSKVWDKDFLDLKYYYEDDNGYLYLKNIYDKYIKINGIKRLNSEDSKYLENIIKDSINKEIDKISSKKSISIGTGMVPVVKLTINMDSKDIYNLVNNTIDDIKNDDKARELLEKIGVSSSNLELLKENIKIEEDKERVEINITSNLFTSSLYEFEVIDINDNEKNSFNYNGYGDKVFSITDNDKTLKLIVTSNSTSDNFSGTVYLNTNDDDSEVSQEQIATVKGNRSKNGYVYTYNTINSSKEKIEVTFSINNEIEDNNFDYEGNLVVKVDSDEDYLQFDVNYNGTISEANKFSENVSQAIDYEKISDEDMNNILLKFEEIFRNIFLEEI